MLTVEQMILNTHKDMIKESNKVIDSIIKRIKNIFR